ncbi:MAG: soluble lytic murein transglycosylase-like protein [Gammaproteobacteria bacterium]|jgi:soluble lytic murein transglycosylase-like protein
MPSALARYIVRMWRTHFVITAVHCRVYLLAFVTWLCTSINASYSATVERPDPELRNLLEKAVLNASSFDDRFDAQVWLLDMSTRLTSLVPEPSLRLQILRAVHREATSAGLEPELVLAVITIESRFDRFALSEAGARGLMQIMPFWLQEIGRPNDNLFIIDTNLAFGCTILRRYLDIERGNLSRALARYNGSLGKTWYPSLVMKAYRQRWTH